MSKFNTEPKLRDLEVEEKIWEKKRRECCLVYYLVSVKCSRGQGSDSLHWGSVSSHWIHIQFSFSVGKRGRVSKLGNYEGNYCTVLYCTLGPSTLEKKLMNKNYEEKKMEIADSNVKNVCLAVCSSPGPIVTTNELLNLQSNVR